MSDHIAERLRSAADTLKLSGSFDGDVLDAGADEIERLLATHARQADTITRLTREHAEVVARLEVMRAEVVGLRGAEADDALVKVVARAGCGTAGLREPAYEWEHASKERKATWRIIARAVLAAISGPLVAAERERCAKIADARSEVLLAARDRNTVPKIRGELERGATEVRGIAATIRTGAPDAQ